MPKVAFLSLSGAIAIAQSPALAAEMALSLTDADNIAAVPDLEL